jgi:ABC-type transporter Mla maintaining outer membrane lipid asymmetry ATPase subunit MlaF/ABC-type transporter Mla maintaining outer membrane lipid asymmetry permease subunit MlaE
VTETASTPTYIEGRGLTLHAGQQTLLENAALRITAGELVLLVGASGGGKSVLLRVLAGLTSGLEQITIHGEVAANGRIGMVFQHGALFEGMSLRDNLQLALDHAQPPRPWHEGEQLLTEVELLPDLALASASGGQRRRIAIARALANAPDILLYDEPTTGLDPALAARVAQLIRKTHEARQMATLIVSHDVQALAPIADRVLFLDPRQHSLRSIDVAELEHLIATGGFRHDDEPSTRSPASSETAYRRLITALTDQGGAWVAASLALASSLWPRWRRRGWGLRALGHQLALVGGPTSLAYVGLAGAVAGCVTVYFAFKYLPHAQYLTPLVTDDLLAAIGFALYRILVPILATILVAARCGAAAASDLAGRSYREEHNALRALGGSPGGYYGFATLAATTLATPVLVLVSFTIARAVALATYGLWDPDASASWIQTMFHAKLRDRIDIFGSWWGTSWVLAKSLVCGATIGAIAVATSLSPKRVPQDVSTAVTRTVLLATIAVLLVHFVFAFIEF